MDEYHFWADVLNKFHTSAEWIQALWLLGVFSLALVLVRSLKDVLVALIRRQAGQGQEARPEGE